MVSIPLRRLKPRALTGLLLTALLAAQAQTQAQTAPSTRATRSDPLDPKAQVPVLRYESSLAPVRRTSDDKPVSWRDANEAVARIGGWRVYAREAQQPEPAAAQKPEVPAQAPAQTPSTAPAPAPAPAAKPMPPGHTGHKH